MLHSLTERGLNRPWDLDFATVGIIPLAVYTLLSHDLGHLA